MMISAVVFDLDGLLVESEEDWERARRDFVTRYGAQWTAEDQRAILGANMRQCCQYIRERFSPPLSDEAVAGALITRRMELYHERLVVLPGAIEAVRSLALQYPLAIASSSPPPVIQFVVAEMGLSDCFRTMASSDEVEHGKPAPDVYLLACERLRVTGTEAIAFEDSDPGIRAAKAAGLRVIAVPNPAYPPDLATLRIADLVLPSLETFRPEALISW
jgi:HAD superfamily hydrolase (TIGR01509 family)